MKNISEIDKNFKVETSIKKDNISFYDVKESPFKIYGIFYEEKKFRRMPGSVAKSINNNGVYALHSNTAGGHRNEKSRLY